MARKIFRQLLSAIDYCHSSCIIHRGNLYFSFLFHGPSLTLTKKKDLKPENILLDVNKNIKLIDFGLSTFCDQDGELNTVCGTPFYAAPEIIKGENYSGPQADVVSTWSKFYF
jgi:5'-AMP-activated protein kinase, catalytic alpha subunit